MQQHLDRGLLNDDPKLKRHRIGSPSPPTLNRPPGQPDTGVRHTGTPRSSMPRIALLSAGLALLLALMPAGPSEAANFRSYLSGKGAGTACTLVAPCPSLADAVAATLSGGTITCVDGLPSGNAGSVPIDRSIPIHCPHGSGGFVELLIDGAGIVVTLRNLLISSLGGGPVGINFLNGASLLVENCLIENFNGPSNGIGIRFSPTAGVTAKLHVSDSIIKGNGLSASGGGIIIQPAGTGSARVVIERTRVENNTYGIFANGTGSSGVIAVEIKDSIVSNSKFNGISAFTAAGASVTSIVVDRSSAVLSGAAGISALGSGAFVTLTDTTVASNVLGLQPVTGGTILSYQNNRLNGNVTDGAPTAVVALK